ncbi:hypothetical protein [Segnochrobactrum spirostomi]|uniref:Uncharacterized protein n=1 Tax=Segnochrobactrum spirostomi TaxID=2608987 RepID=A0A6A7Y9I4_9HYPH|nr:hypothetical protein [Segnochrobactrum spirostomi]MQT14668.1 hypothetical protein [Segnochrobactrum spirostomi]
MLRIAVLLGSVSFVGTLIAPAAQAQTLVIVNRGTNGIDNVDFGGYPTRGGDAAGASVVLSQSYAGSSGTAIELGSVGGWGGNGDWNLVTPNVWGEFGGHGGDISLQQPGGMNVSGGSDRQTMTPLISLYSLGGAGGMGATRSGGGNVPGSVSAELNGIVSATGNNMAGIFLLSEAGGSGQYHGIPTPVIGAPTTRAENGMPENPARASRS